MKHTAQQRPHNINKCIWMFMSYFKIHSSRFPTNIFGFLMNRFSRQLMTALIFFEFVRTVTESKNLPRLFHRLICANVLNETFRGRDVNRISRKNGSFVMEIPCVLMRLKRRGKKKKENVFTVIQTTQNPT